MTEIINSVFLKRVLERAKALDEKTNPTITAERFLAALADEMQAPEESCAEMAQVRQLLEKESIDLAAARPVLMEHIMHDSSGPLLGGIYMQKKMFEAKALVQKNSGQELTADFLLLRILEDPSEGVKKALGNPEKAEEIPASAEVTPKSIKEKLAEVYGVTQEQLPEEQKEDMESRESQTQLAKEAMAKLVADVRAVRKELQSCIYGQDNAINVFATGYFQASMLAMIDPFRKRPRATFLFAGPPGVGKTFMAEKIADALELPFMRFDMSEYADKEANIEFCGSDRVYKNSKAGNVTSFVAENPQCVLLFDEVEKAHLTVIHLFLQMLDAGRLRDNHTDEEVSFSDAIIILTTNAGKQLYEESEDGDLSSLSRKVIIKALQKDINPNTQAPYFPSAICSRFASGNVVMFNHMGAHNLRTIAKRQIEKHATNLEQETGIKMQIDERVYTALLFAEGSAADARTVRSRAEAFFNHELYELLRLVASEKENAGIENIEKIRIAVDLKGVKAGIAELFAASDPTGVLVFAHNKAVDLCKNKVPDMDFMGAQSMEQAVELMKTRRFDFVLLDIRYGASGACSLNAEDAASPARDFFKFLREQKKELPVYLIEDRGTGLSEEERISFTRQGVRGILRFSGPKEVFAAQLHTIAAHLHQQASMRQLAKENKLVSFETAQSLSRNGKQAEIKLFDFEMAVAVESEDAKSVLSAMSKPNVHFSDVIGAGDAKQELQYFVEYLKNPQKYMGTGVKAPRGVILYGPPGTGKTLLAKAMACEAGVTFIAAEGNEFLKRYVGEGSEKVHQLFKTARKYAPSILFIDEIDAIAKERRGGANAGNNGEETLTALLTEMDGFVSDPTRPVFVLAATNFDVEPGGDKSLDPALMRRFDRRVYIDLPNKEERIRFLKMKIGKNPALVISQAQVENIALRSTGMSLAELDSAVELALRSAIRQGSTIVSDGIFEEAFETFNNGEAKKWDAAQLERVARHEAGHALICWLSGQTPSYLTIVARGNHGGYMQNPEQEGKAIYTKEELLARIRTCLGGRAAEIAYYGQQDGISTGASGDLAAATGIAQQLVCTYGMDEEFGLAVVNGMAAGGAMSLEVRTAVNRILAEQMRQAVRLIAENKDKIDALVAALLAENHLNSNRIAQVIRQGADACHA